VTLLVLLANIFGVYLIELGSFLLDALAALAFILDCFISRFSFDNSIPNTSVRDDSSMRLLFDLFVLVAVITDFDTSTKSS